MHSSWYKYTFAVFTSPAFLPVTRRCLFVLVRCLRAGFRVPAVHRANPRPRLPVRLLAAGAVALHRMIPTRYDPSPTLPVHRRLVLFHRLSLSVFAVPRLHADKLPS